MSKSKNTNSKNKNFKVNQLDCKTVRQQELHDSIINNEITIANGEAGTGKTFIALWAALKLLADPTNKYTKIVLVKSVTSIQGEDVGYLPGDVDDKMKPYIVSYTSNLKKLTSKINVESLFKTEQIEVLPLAYIRGMSIDNSIVIMDEVQNIDLHTFKTLITRIGDNSKYIFMGDSDQVDRKKGSCLSKVMDIFETSDVVKIIRFLHSDCVRNPIIPKILDELRKHEL